MWARLAALVSRIQDLFARRTIERDLNSEIEHHLDLLTAEDGRRGMPPLEARRLARAKFGGVTQIQQTVREQAGFPWLESMLQDIRYAARGLVKGRTFTVVAVLTLALGIGGSTALFSLLDAVVLKALPYADPDRLVTVSGREGARVGMRVPIPLFDAFRERSATLEDVSTHNVVGGALQTPDGPVRISGQRVSSTFVELIGVPLLAGRGFRQEEEEPGASAVMVVTHGFWQQRLGGDPEAVGHTLFLDDVPYTVVGIMPPEFRWYLGGRDDFWTPYGSAGVRELEQEIGHEVLARLRPGITIDDAERELRGIAATVPVDGWGPNGRTLDLLPFKEAIVGDRAVALQLLGVAVFVVLVIACANLAQLLLARADRRKPEFATRKAIGASTSRLIRLVLVESLLLSAAGGLAGVMLAFWLVPVLLTLAPPEIPRIADATIDGRVLAVALALSVLTGCTFGLAPALRLSRSSVVQALKHGPAGGESHRGWMGAALVVGQVAASVTLFVLAGLIGRTFLTLLPSNPGFQVESRTMLALGLQSHLYPDRLDRVRRWEELVQQVRELPGIARAALGTNVPFADDLFFAVRDVTNGDTPESVEVSSEVRGISTNFFEILQMPLVRGRNFEETDGPESPGVAIVNQTLARRLGPDGYVVGRRLRAGGWAALPTHEIVGVVADTRSSGATTEVWNEVYIPYAQNDALFGILIVVSDFNAETLDDMLRPVIRAWAPANPDAPWLRAMSLHALLNRSVAGPRFSAMLISAFSGMALLLAVIGVFGLVAYGVSQRLKELGIRAALGARPRDLIVTTVRSAVVLTTAGVVLGCVAAGYLTRFVASQLYGIEPLDVPTFLGAGAVMVVVAGAGASVAAQRAARADPMTVLRVE